MNVEVKVAPSFARAVRPLLKKYRSLKNELRELEMKLLATPELGTPLGSRAFKIRLAIRSKGKGKSGGARVITYMQTEVVILQTVAEEKTIVNLLTIYDKSEVESISTKELRELIALLDQATEN